MKYVGHYKVC